MRRLISYRELRLGMRIADKPRGYPRVVEITPRGFAVERSGYGFFPKVGRVKILVEE